MCIPVGFLFGGADGAVVLKREGVSVVVDVSNTFEVALHMGMLCAAGKRCREAMVVVRVQHGVYSGHSALYRVFGGSMSAKLLAYLKHGLLRSTPTVAKQQAEPMGGECAECAGRCATARPSLVLNRVRRIIRNGQCSARALRMEVLETQDCVAVKRGIRGLRTSQCLCCHNGAED